MKFSLLFAILIVGCCAPVRDPRKAVTPSNPTTPSVDSKRDMPPAATPSTAVHSDSAAQIDAGAWEQVASVDDDHWFSTIYAEEDRWLAGGKEFVLEGNELDNRSARQELPKRFIQEITMVPGSGVIAVGSFELVLERNTSGWVEKHWAAKSRTGARPFADVLSQVAVVKDGDKMITLAWGPIGILQKETGPPWFRPAGRRANRLRDLGNFGASDDLSCPAKIWRWFDRGRAWYLCHDGRSFVLDEHESKALPTLSKECADRADAVSVQTHGVALSCEDKVQVWRSDETQWQHLPTPSEEVRALSLSRNCVYAVSERSVWRNCRGARRAR